MNSRTGFKYSIDELSLEAPSELFVHVLLWNSKTFAQRMRLTSIVPMQRSSTLFTRLNTIFSGNSNIILLVESAPRWSPTPWTTRDLRIFSNHLLIKELFYFSPSASKSMPRIGATNLFSRTFDQKEEIKHISGISERPGERVWRSIH